VEQPALASGPSRDYGYYRQALAGRALPLAYVDLDGFDHNADALAALAGGKPVRLATKSVRCVALLRRALNRSPTFRGLMSYSIPEAVHLCRSGFDDVLVGYPSAQKSELRTAAELCWAGKNLTLMVDCQEHVALVADAAQAVGAKIPVCIELDVSTDYRLLYFGARRSPVKSAAQALTLARAVLARPSLRLEGLMGYEAQLAGIPDQVPGARTYSAAVRLLKRDSGRRLFRRRQEAVRQLRALAPTIRFVNAGGTGSLATSCHDDSVSELTAGSGLLAPWLFDKYRGLQLRPAGGFALSIARRPARGLYTCHGGGYIASGAPGRDRLPLPHLPPGASLLPTEAAGEVQTPVRYRGPAPLTLGDPIFFRHAKAGELCEHFRTLHLISGGKVVEVVPTYRGEGQCFL
jgi:D-serine deaminase-like pyridoxal phosphate-dependent protein